MLFKIIVNIILTISIFIYGIENNIFLTNIKCSIIIALLCVGLSIYMLYEVKLKNEKTLLFNILYMSIVSYIYPPAIAMLFIMIIEYVQLKKYSQFINYIIIFSYIFISIKLRLGYSNIFLGAIVLIFILEITNYEDINIKLKKENYELKEKNYELSQKNKIDNKVSYQNLESVKIEERNMISQKLHDKIGHTLAGSIMQLEALKIIMKNDEEKITLMLDSIINNLRDGMNDIRKTLRMIKPDQSKLTINNLKLMLDEFSKKSSIDTNLKIEGDINEINLVYLKSIIECINEILTNSMKYCNGDVINVEISILNKIVRVFVKDNGFYQGNISKGMGLLGIEERIINLGGNVYFNNEDGFSHLIILNR